MAIQTFVADTILTAAQMNALQGNDYNQTVNTSTASYVLVASDKGTKRVMNAAGSTTITVNTSLFSAGDTLTILNIGAGVTTVTAGTATVSSAGSLALSQYASGTLYFTSAGVSVFEANGVTATGAPQVVAVQTSSVATGSTIMPLDDTIPQITEGNQYMTLAITPTSATSNLVINVVATANCSQNVNMVMALFQDATANALAATSFKRTADQRNMPIVLNYKMTAGTTSATTFTVRIGPESAATVTFNGDSGARLLGGVAASTIIITEYK